MTTFGTTGYTYEHTFLIYDRKSDSVWYPLSGDSFEAVSGELKGAQLPFIAKPVILPLSEWAAKHPKTVVMVPDGVLDDGAEATNAVPSSQPAALDDAPGGT